MKLRVFFSVLAAVTSTWQATAQAQGKPELPRAFAMEWTVKSVPESTKQTAKFGEYISIGDIEPLKSVQLVEEIHGRNTLASAPAGLVLAPSIIDPRVMCEPVKRPKKKHLTCLGDRDGDGLFDSITSISDAKSSYGSTTKFNPMIGMFRTRKWQLLDAPVRYGEAVEGGQGISLPMDLILQFDRGGSRTTTGVCYVYKKGVTLMGFDKSEPFCLYQTNEHAGQYPYKLRRGALTIDIAAIDTENKTFEFEISGWGPGTAL